MPSLRRVESADVAILRDLRLRALATDPLAFGSTLAREQTWTERWQRWADEHASGGALATFLAFADDGTPAGLAGGIRDGGRPEQYELFSVWVAPEHRGAGHSSRLIEAVAAWARASGGRALVLWVTDPRAQRLYERAGFAADGRRMPLEHAPAVIEIGMTRPLV
jgi:GNAT superfamily N-acetyltransferase